MGVTEALRRDLKESYRKVNIEKVHDNNEWDILAWRDLDHYINHSEALVLFRLNNKFYEEEVIRRAAKNEKKN